MESNVEARRIVDGLRATHLRQPEAVEAAMGCLALAYSHAMAAAAENIRSLEDALSVAFDAHKDAASCAVSPVLAPYSAHESSAK